MWKTMGKALKPNASWTDDEVKKVKDFMFLRWLGDSHETVLMSAQFNRYSTIPTRTLLETVNDAVGAKRIYISYIKKSNISTEYDYALQWYYNIPQRLVQEYLEFISPEQLSEITELYSEYAKYAPKEELEKNKGDK